jgi:hypothetical protein
MKKLLLILLCPILLLTSCSKSGVTPQSQSLEDVIVGVEWSLTNENEDGFLLAEDGKFYLTQKCQSNTPIGNWIIDGDFIKYQFTDSTQEITIVWGEVTEYSESQIKLLDYSDSLITITEVYILGAADIYGCMNEAAANYNSAAVCNEQDSCIYISIEDELVGSWERSSVEYDYTQFAYVEEYDEFGNEVLVGYGNFFQGSHLLTENSMAEFFNRDRYVIELHSNGTYDKYEYWGSGFADTSEGTWSVDLEFITIDNDTYSYTKDANYYKIATSSNFTSKIWLDYATFSGDYGGDEPNDYLEIENVFETFIRIN